MIDSRIQKLASILVDHSAQVQPGDKVAIETTTNAEPLVRAVYEQVLQRGGHAHLLLNLADQEKIFFAKAGEAQLDFTPVFQSLVTEKFDVYIRARADIDPRALSDVPPAKQARYQKAYAPIRNTMIQRGASGALRWVLTQFPTEGYAKEAGMSFKEYEDFLYCACHADEGTTDPVAYWRGVQGKQREILNRIQGHNIVRLCGPNVDLTLSIKGRKFVNSSGQHNMPDGEIYTGPVENSASGWVRYTYPAIHQGRIVEGIELTFNNGRVTFARADKGEKFLLQMLDLDPGARYIGEFAIGTNFEIDRFTHNILFDEKLGGTFHMALGKGYPETGSVNNSVIHWDMICDLRKDSEISVDGEVIYRDGQFTI